MTPAAIPAPYLARAKWVRVTPDDLPAAELRGRVTQAYAIVRAGLTKKVQAGLPPVHWLSRPSPYFPGLIFCPDRR